MPLECTYLSFGAFYSLRPVKVLETFQNALKRKIIQSLKGIITKNPLGVKGFQTNPKVLTLFELTWKADFRPIQESRFA